ncbi:MAG: hypothetical protein ACREF4_02560 [Gammaproteobacteria bacterium]
MLGNALPLGLLLAYGVAFATVALGFSLIAFDDHPGQLYRVWHVVTRGFAPWTWNPGWWAGYPELQFYPPGFAYLVALLHLGSRGVLSVTAAYQTFVWIAYLAPGLTAWLLLRRVLGSGWPALPGAFLALTLSADLASGVEGGVHVGMVPARLGWALLPLVPLTLAGWMSGERAFPRAAVPLLAAIALIHPAHLPAAVVLVLVAAAVAARQRRIAAFTSGALALGLAAGLTGFWTVPLLLHAEHTRALAWGSLSAGGIFGHPLALALLVLAAFDVYAWRRSRPAAADMTVVLAVFPWAMVVVVLVDALVLEPAGVHWLPADRIADSAWLAFALSAGAAMGRLVGSVSGDRRRGALALAAVAVAIVFALPSRALTLWPRAPEWTRYETIERGMRLPALWSALRAAPAGRVFFVRSGVPLVYGSDWWRAHSHVTALTPLAAGREIVNGTFTHPAPIAALVYRGDAGRGAIRELVERLDGRRLFGRDLDALDADTFNRYADRLGVSVVVALDEDVPCLGALRDNPAFTRVPSSPPFVVYARRSAVILPREIVTGHLRLPEDSPADGWIPARVAYYPLWRATSEGRALETRRGMLGDLEVKLARPGAAVDLVYARGAAETTGMAVTALSVLALAWIIGATGRAPR